MIYLNYEVKELHNALENYNHRMYGIKHTYIYSYILF